MEDPEPGMAVTAGGGHRGGGRGGASGWGQGEREAALTWPPGNLEGAVMLDAELKANPAASDTQIGHPPTSHPPYSPPPHPTPCSSATPSATPTAAPSWC